MFYSCAAYFIHYNFPEFQFCFFKNWESGSLKFGIDWKQKG